MTQQISLPFGEQTNLNFSKTLGNQNLFNTFKSQDTNYSTFKKTNKLTKDDSIYSNIKLQYTIVSNFLTKMNLNYTLKILNDEIKNILNPNTIYTLEEISQILNINNNEDDMNYKYFDCNGDCAEEDNFYPMTACDDDGIAGHFILRYTNGDVHTLRIGFVIVDDKKRGCGVGKQMINLALRYAFTVAGAEKVTIGVFETNTSAYYCYKSSGFREAEVQDPEIYDLFGEKIRIIELAADKDSYGG